MKVNAYSYAKLVQLLTLAPHSAQELADETGLHVHTVREYVRELVKAGVVRVASWQEDARGRCTIAEFELSSKPSVKRPRLTAAQRAARYRDARKLLAGQRAIAAIAATPGRTDATDTITC